jgi:pimeloyl-ACP methyl ester carboxylesterase
VINKNSPKELPMKDSLVFKSEAGKKAILDQYDLILSRWPVANQQIVIPTHLGDTFILTCGDETAPPLVLLHGSSSNLAIWIGDVVEYSQNYHVIAIDIPGEPGRSMAVRPKLDSSAYAEWMNEVFAFLNIHSAVLLGISLGGWLALKFATAYPEKVSALVLICPSGIARQRISFLLKAIFFSFFGPWGVDRLIHIVYGNQKMLDEVLDYSRLIAAEFSPRIEIIPLYTDEELKKLTMPVLLIAGESDALLPSKKAAERLKWLLPRFKALIFPKTGHVLLNLAVHVMPFLAESNPS